MVFAQLRQHHYYTPIIITMSPVPCPPGYHYLTDGALAGVIIGSIFAFVALMLLVQLVIRGIFAATFWA